MSATTAPQGKITIIVLWVIKILLALAFAAASFAKLSGQPAMAAEFLKLPGGDLLRYFTGTLEIVSAILIVIPRTAFFGALGMCVVCIGAFAARVAVLHGDLVHVFVMLAMAGVVAWYSRPGKI